MSVLETNYLDELKFLEFLLAIPKLEVYNTYFKGRVKLSPERMQLLFNVCYYCALRISETIRLVPADFNLERQILTVKRSKTGKNQLTSIPQPLIARLTAAFEVCPDQTKLFDISRVTAWHYGKEAGKLAGLNIYERQEQKEIEGVWTHLFRKSFAKMMYKGGASGALIDVKLRHRHKTKDMAESTWTYIKPDINELIFWENKHFDNP